MRTTMKKKSSKSDDCGGAGGKRKITKRETVTRIVQGVEEDGGKNVKRKNMRELTPVNRIA